MPIPKPTSGQDEQEYISACIREIIGEYDVEGQAYAVCKTEYDKMSAEEEAQQGGVVSPSPASFARTKFVYAPKGKEKMNDFMKRCMEDVQVRERKPSRTNRAYFCYSSFEDFYVMSIGQRWK
jgi:hypothetical protein